MDSRLLVPASASLLDGWCGPVVLLDAHGGPALAGAHLYRDGRVSVFADWTAAAFDATTVCSLHGEIDRVSLDLSRAECRDRVARVLFDEPFTFTLSRHAAYACMVFGRRGRMIAAASEACAVRNNARHLPALADFNPKGSGRELAGSRDLLEDALALAAVAREVLRAG